MSTRFQLRICLAAILAAIVALPTHAAVTVIGSGMARDCYQAVEYRRTSTAAAIEVCDRALELENLRRRDKAATYVNRGILYMRDGRNDRALQDFERGVAMMPDLLEAKVNLGAALYNLGRYDEALVALNEGLGADSIDARATGHYNRALIYERGGDIAAAYNDFRAALDLAPDFEMAALQLERFSVVPVTD